MHAIGHEASSHDNAVGRASARVDHTRNGAASIGQRLAEDVNEWLESESPLRAHSGAEVHAAGVLDDVKPMTLLQGLGRATSSLPPLYVPGAATMVGLSALRASSQ
jgi:hypothetical protein